MCLTAKKINKNSFVSSIKIGQYNIIKCINNHEAKFICYDINCQNYPFKCIQKSCVCKNIHLKCKNQIQLNIFKHEIENRIIRNNPKTKVFANEIKSLFLHIQSKLEQTFQTFQDWTQYMGLNSTQYKFHKLMKENRYHQIKGTMVGQVKKLFDIKPQDFLPNSQEIIDKVRRNADILLKQMSVMYIKQNKKKKNISDSDVEKPFQKPINQQNQNHKQQLPEKLNSILQTQIKLFSEPSCIQKKLAVLICVQQNCQQIGFICESKDCKCKQIHSKCQFTEWVSLVQQFNIKIKKNNQINQVQMDKLRQTIEQGMINVQKLYQKFNDQKTLLGLNQYQIQFYKLMRQREFKSMQGKLVSMIVKDLKNNTFLNSRILRNQQQIITTSFESLINQMQKIFRQPTQNEMLFDDFQKVKNQFDSSIIRQTQQKIILMSFFLPKRLKHINLIYRASQNGFSTTKFHSKCDNIYNTVVIIKTQFGKIIGGFTPLKWNKNRHNIFEVDQLRESFIFSISLREKMQLIYPEKAIQNHNSYGPRFGGTDIAIADQANLNNDSRAYFPNSYNNGLYKNNQQSYSKFSGQVNGYLFRISQWQVFHVQFEQY